MTKWTKLQCPTSHRKPDLFIYFILSTFDVWHDFMWLGNLRVTTNK